MPRTAVPYVGQPYDASPGTIRMAELARRRADDQAALVLRRGDISASMGQQLAGVAGQVAGMMGQRAADAPKQRAAEAAARAEAEKRRILAGSVDPETGKPNFGQAARETMAIDPAAALALWDRAGAEEKSALLMQKQKVDDLARVAGSLWTAVAKLPPPERQAAYSEARADVIRRGLVPEEALDPVFKLPALKAMVAQAMDAQDLFQQIEDVVKPPEPFTLSEGQTRFDAAGQPLANVPKPVPPPKEPEPFTLSPGSVRYDAQGKRIASVPREPSAPAAKSFQRIETVDDAGNPVIQFMTAEEVRAQGGVKTSPKTTAKASGPATVDAILSEIDGLSQQINTSGSGPLANLSGLTRRGMAAGNMDNTVSEYQALVNGFIPMVARAVGHTGVLTQLDVDSVRDLFPKPTDNRTLAASKIDRVRRIMAAMQPETGSAPRPVTPPATPAAPKNPFRK